MVNSTKQLTSGTHMITPPPTHTFTLFLHLVSSTVYPTSLFTLFFYVVSISQWLVRLLNFSIQLVVYSTSQSIWLVYPPRQSIYTYSLSSLQFIPLAGLSKLSISSNLYILVVSPSIYTLFVSSNQYILVVSPVSCQVVSR